MLNYSTTSISLEKQEERDEYSVIDVSRIKYSRKESVLIYPVHRYIEGGTAYVFRVKRQKESYLEGGWVAIGEGVAFNAYTLRSLKAKIICYIELN